MTDYGTWADVKFPNRGFKILQFRFETWLHAVNSWYGVHPMTRMMMMNRL